MSTEKQGFSRRRFIQGAGAAATAGLVHLGQSEAVLAATTTPQPFQPRGKLRQRPNFLFVMVDEYRAPVAYESPQLQQFRAQYLVAEESLRNNGLQFLNHYIMATACVPSRTSITTGQYPSLHGASQTTGAAKASFEDDMFWLDPSTVPTMGDYFRAGGYDTYYKGKWHVSDADLLIPGTHDQVVSFDQQGHPVPSVVNNYLGANRLDNFGFDGWIGPEPHGSNPLNSGSSAAGGTGRDQTFADQTIQLLQTLAQEGPSANPWLTVCSFVNPHDITAYGKITLAAPGWNLLGQLVGSKVPTVLFDPTQYAATSGENLASKPGCQASYLQTYQQMLQPTDNTLAYRRFYYQMQENVNQQVQRVLDALASYPSMAQNTIVIFTSDHGTMLGAHGGMFQKWHQAYEETLHVPFILNSPVLFSGQQTLNALTSHADLLPTMLGLAGLNPAGIQQQLAQTHNEVHPLVGRDLSGVVLGLQNPNTLTDPVYFMTDDEVSRGANAVTFIGNQMYAPVNQPNHVETVVANLPTGARGALEKWKYSRYSDNPQFWSDPESISVGDQHLPPFQVTTQDQDNFTLVQGNLAQAGTKTATTTVKTTPAPDQIEAYNVTKDPLELSNLSNSASPAVKAVLAQLDALLEAQCKAKRLKPSSGVVPSQPDC